MEKLDRMETYIRETCSPYENQIVVYVLRSVTKPNMMYVGYTTNILRRLREHNGIIKGGGKYTSANRPWRLAALVPMPSKSEALKVEYWAKAKNYASQKGIPRNDPIERRIYLLELSMKTHNYNKVIYLDPEFKAFKLCKYLDQLSS